MRNNGFSLIELLFVVGMITIILSVILVNAGDVGLNSVVNASANQVMDLIKKIRHDSVAIKEFQTNLFPSYGAYFDMNTPREIVVFADCLIDDNNDGTINDSDFFAFDPTSTNCNGGNGFVATSTLDHRVVISEIRSVEFGSNNTESKIYLEFVRPEPTIWITLDDDSLLQAGYIEVDLTDIKGKFTQTLVFWNTGQVAIR